MVRRVAGRRHCSPPIHIGKLAIAWYIGTQGLESTYGAAASIVVLLIWIYWSAQIVLFGAEISHVYALTAGNRDITRDGPLAPHRSNNPIKHEDCLKWRRARRPARAASKPNEEQRQRILGKEANFTRRRRCPTNG